jgi:hypothetical protein
VASPLLVYQLPRLLLQELDVTSTKRPLMLLATVASLVLVSALAAEAQVMYPLPPAPPGYPSLADASVRLQVKPREAQVFVDGYYAGIVDEFDGMFQRLRTQPGRHEIILYLDGFRTVHQNVYLMPDKTLDLKLKMEPLGQGEMNEARPIPAHEESASGAPSPFPGGRSGNTGIPAGGPPPPSQPQGGNAPGVSGIGTLSIDLNPPDAEVLLDGQPVSIPRGQGPLMVDLSEGHHSVQVRKPGYVGYLSEVEIHRAETSTLNITLRAQP